MKRIICVCSCNRIVVAAMVTFLTAAIAAAGVAFYVYYMVMPVVAARRMFLDRLTERGGSFVAFYGQDPCACSPFERGKYHLKEISAQTISKSWDFARDWALWRMTAVSLTFPRGVSPKEKWILSGLAVMPPMCALEFSGAAITDHDVGALLSACPFMFQGPSVRSIAFKECVLHASALESLLKGLPPQAWVALGSCDIRGGALRESEERKDIFGLSVARMKLEEQQWRSLFSCLSCQHLQLLFCEGVSSSVWNEILRMPTLEEVELGFGDQGTIDALINSSATNASVKTLSVHMDTPSFTGSLPGFVKALVAKFLATRELNLSTVEISDDSLQYLASLQNLEKLVLYVNQTVGPLKTLEECRRLQCIKLYASHVSTSTETTLAILKERGIEVFYEKTNISAIATPD